MIDPCTACKAQQQYTPCASCFIGVGKKIREVYDKCESLEKRMIELTKKIK